jgi:hypothetical protein
MSDATGQYEIYVEPIGRTGAQRKVSVDGGTAPVWRPDGRELYFVADTRLMAGAPPLNVVTNWQSAYRKQRRRSRAA